MITPYLEKLITEGKAEYRETAVGGSGVGTIPVQTGEKVVIIDFTWHPFTDVVPVFTIIGYHIDYFPIFEATITDLSSGNLFAIDQLVHGADPGNTGKILDAEVPDFAVDDAATAVLVAAGAAPGDDINFYDATGLILIATGVITNVTGTEITFHVTALPPIVFDMWNLGAVEDTTILGGVKAAWSVQPDFHVFIEATGGDWSAETDLNCDTSAASATISSSTGTSFGAPSGVTDATSGATASVLQDTGNGFSPAFIRVDTIVGTFSDQDFLVGSSGAQAYQNGAPVPAYGPLDEDATVISAVNSCIHHLRFKSKGVVAVYNFRDNPYDWSIIEQGEEPPFFVWVLPDPTVVNTYIVCQETVQIDIWKFSPSGNLFSDATVIGGLPAEAKEPVTPNGYSGLFPVVEIATGAGATIWNLTAARQRIPGLPRGKDQFVDDITALTQLNGPPPASPGPLSPQQYPLVNIGYVLIRNEKEVL